MNYEQPSSPKEWWSAVKVIQEDEDYSIVNKTTISEKRTVNSLYYLYKISHESWLYSVLDTR